MLKQCDPLWEEGGSGTRIFGNQGLNEGRTENDKSRASPSEENKANKNHLPKVGSWGCTGKRWAAATRWRGGNLELSLVCDFLLIYESGYCRKYRECMRVYHEVEGRPHLSCLGFAVMARRKYTVNSYSYTRIGSISRLTLLRVWVLSVLTQVIESHFFVNTITFSEHLCV